jgi:hypothetical protein
MRDSVSLTTACATAKIGYFAGRDAIMRGELEGWKALDGKWAVSRESLTRFIRERQQREEELADSTSR